MQMLYPRIDALLAQYRLILAGFAVLHDIIDELQLLYNTLPKRRYVTLTYAGAISARSSLCSKLLTRSVLL